MRRILNIALALVIAMSMMSCAAQKNNTLQQANSTYTINKTIKGGTVAVRDGGTLMFQKGGKIVNATITGRNIKIVSCGTDVAFEGCDFANATIANSNLQATNLGLVPNMTSKSHSYTYKGIRFNTTKNQGTDNTAAWKQLAQFLSNSSGVKMTFNGNFYSSEKVKDVTIVGANNLELSGGSMVMGLHLTNCSNVSVHDMKWVGYEGAHDFPPIFTKGETTINGVRYNINNAFHLNNDRMASMGVAGDAIKIDIDNDNKRSENITVQRCHFEMRQNGLSVGVRNSKRIVRNVKCLDCTASHIIYQPVGFHSSNCQVNNMVAEYCLQGVDISTCSNNITVTNSRFTRCATGPKQETTQEFKSMTHSNVIDNCYFGINDDYFLLDGSNFILSVSEGAKGDVFTVRNTTFDVKRNRNCGSIKNRTSCVVLDNVNINVDLKLHPQSSEKWSMIEMFSIFGATSFSPTYELNNVVINLAEGTHVNTLCSPHVSGGLLNVKATGVTITGRGTIDTYFNSINSVKMTNCSLALKSSTVSKGVTTMDVADCTIADTKCLFVGDKSNATLKLKNNSITSDKVVDFKTTPKLVEMQGNIINMTGGEAFAGADTKANINSKNFKVNGNTFMRKSRDAKLMPSNSKSSKLLNNNSVK